MRKEFEPKKFNKIERIYIALFLISILGGIIYGIINPDYYIPAEEAGDLDLQEGENNFTIFYRNFFVSALDLVTVGLTSFFANFITFATVSSFLHSEGVLFAMIFMLPFGIFEFGGSLLFGLVGVGLAEKALGRFFKVKTKMNLKIILLVGAILLFVASIIEYGLILFLRTI